MRPLTKYIIRRTLQAIPLLFIISIISFLLMTLAPGDPTAMYENPEAGSEQDFSAIKEQLGVDQPIYIQYYKWLKLLVLEGNLGYSFQDGQPVMDKIVSRIPATLTLMGTAMLIAILLAIPIGVYSAVKKYSPLDYIFTFNSFLGIAVPSFFIALVVILVFSLKLEWFPASGLRSNFDTFDL